WSGSGLTGGDAGDDRGARPRVFLVVGLGSRSRTGCGGGLRLSGGDAGDDRRARPRVLLLLLLTGTRSVNGLRRLLRSWFRRGLGGCRGGGEGAVGLDDRGEQVVGRHRLLRVQKDVTEAHRRVVDGRSEEHTSELQSRENLVCRLLLEKKNTT